MSKREDSALAARRRRAVEAFGNAAAAIGPIEAGMSVFALTRGQFSMIDCIHHVANELTPCHMSVWTWAIADYEVLAVGGLMDRGDVLTARLVVDFSAGRRNADLLDAWRARFGDDTVKVCKNHAKIARVWNGGRRVLLRGSFNLNYNPRFEQLDVTEGGADYDLVERVENEMPCFPVSTPTPKPRRSLSWGRPSTWRHWRCSTDCECGNHDHAMGRHGTRLRRYNGRRPD